MAWRRRVSSRSLGAIGCVGQPFLIKRWRDTEGYHEVDCFDVMFFILKSAPFEWSVKREFGKVWGAINDLNGQVGHLRGELKRRE